MKITFILIAIYLLSFSYCYSQQTITYKIDEDFVYENPEISPMFKDGVKGYLSYFRDSLRYPKVAKQNKLTGTVIVKIIIERDGSISNPIIVKSLSKDFDLEAIRLIKHSPKWNPGIQYGKKIRSSFDCPIEFKLVE